MDDPSARRTRNPTAAPQAELVRDQAVEIISSRFLEFLNDYSSVFEGETSQTGSQPRVYRDYAMQAEAMKVCSYYPVI